MEIRVKTIFSMEKYVGGHTTQTLELDDGSTLYNALEKLVALYGSDLGEKLFDGKEVRKGIVLYVNGRNAKALNSIETPLNEDDIVLIMPPVGGG